MTWNLVLQCVLYVAVLLALAKPLGEFFARVLVGERTFLTPALGWLERLTYKASGVDPQREMRWTEYAIAALIFNVVGLLAVYALQRLQGVLPLNPADLGAVSPDSSWNTAVSFASNTNWQGYGGESTMSYLTQMLGLNVQNFVSAATGIAVLAALARTFTRRGAGTIGNFWADLTRSTLYILLPLSFILALALVSQGVVQTFGPYVKAQTVERIDYEEPKKGPEDKPVMEKKSTQEQTLPRGPAASQIAIKQVGTNGGGFFNVNSAHPFENPTPLANFLEMLAILLIAAALPVTFGRMIGDVRQGWAILAAMTAVFVVLLSATVIAEQSGNPMFEKLGLSSAENTEGKEVRFGIASSAIWATATTAASNGSVNAMHDSFTPLGGLVPMWLMQLGEVIFGGVGSGLYGMLVFALVAVFVAGLMIGRTPEYLGKKVEAFEMKMASVAILLPPLVVLGGTAIAVLVEPGKAGIANPGAHGFSEILYAFSSAGNNNGSAFAGLSANTPFYNSALGFAMLFARYWLLIPVLAIAGSIAAKKTVPVGPGTLPTHGPLFVVLLIGVVLIMGALTFVPALALGPMVEHFQMPGNCHRPAPRRANMGRASCPGRFRVLLHAAPGNAAPGPGRMTEPRPTVLIVEDEPDIRRFLRSSLGADGYRVVEAESGERGAIDAGTHKPDLAIVDLGRPDIDGVEVIRRIRAWSPMPILVLSARAQERSKIEALDAGADDYVTKPFGVGELLARVRVALRHATRPPSGKVLVFGSVTVNFEKRHAVHGATEVHLTPIEFRLLGCLAKHLGMVVTHRQLLREVWGPSHVEHTHYLRIYMKQLREKLEADPVRPRHLVTETGVGYRLVAEES